ncbi:MAG: DUF1800 domain-containing protein [Roseococcus sp.]
MESGYHQAAMRFGHGHRLGDPLPDDVLAWLDAQTRGPGAPLAPPEGRDMQLDLAEGFAAWRAHELSPPGPGQIGQATQLFRREQRSWVQHLVTSQEPFRDRLTTFWLNHFTVAERAGYGVSSIMGVFLRESIRPHVGGRFADMLLAAARMPAMLDYLDQIASVGPNSPFGRRTGRGLNENLAREILELHTLSPAGGYRQEDVTQFALVMTGWGVERLNPPLGRVFRQDRHEPGEKRLLGRRFAEGPEAFEAALHLLADHPATHRHLARRLVRHFIADEPPPHCVAAIEDVLRDTQGDLGAATRALIRLPEAWTPPLGKLRTPHDYVLALHRAAGGTNPTPIQDGMTWLGQPLWNAPQPNGWSDLAEAWAGPEQVMQRLDLCFGAAGHYGRRDPLLVLETALGPLARPETRTAARRAGSQRDALSLVFACPEMQRR